MQGAGKEAFEAVYETEDVLGNHGVRLSKEIVKVAGRAMEKNFTSLGPYVLPISEQYKVVKALALRKVTGVLFPLLFFFFNFSSFGREWDEMALEGV